MLLFSISLTHNKRHSGILILTLAVAWQENGMIEVAITRGRTRLQARSIDEGSTASMIFSKINRKAMA